MLDVFMISVAFYLLFYLLSVITLSVLTLNDIMLRVAAPQILDLAVSVYCGREVQLLRANKFYNNDHGKLQADT